MSFNSAQRLILLLVCITMACNELKKDDSSKNVEGIIQENLKQMSKYIERKEPDSLLSMFEDSDESLLVGSDSSEVKHGRKEIRSHIYEVMAKPYRIHFDFSGASIYSTPEIAWAFSNKTIVIEAEMGEKTTSAYRLTSVWVKRGNKCKLKLFNGSVPEKR